MKKIAYASLMLVLVAANIGMAAPVFSDNFESGSLSQWTGVNGGPHSGVIVADPLNASNNVLHFIGKGLDGDLFSPAIPVPAGQPITLSFDYLGTNANSGGAVVYTKGLVADVTNWGEEPDPISWNNVWLADSDSFNGIRPAPYVLATDNQWHSYSITFTPVWSNPRIMLQDYIYSGTNTSAYFDNVSVTPEPVSLVLLGTGSLFLLRRRRH